MAIFVSYVVHATCYWVVLALIYGIWLRKETFFTANRLYLLLGVLAGCVLPMAKIPVLPAVAAVYLSPVYLLSVFVIKPDGASIAVDVVNTGWWVLLILWGAGAGLALLRLLWGLQVLVKLIYNARQRTVDNGICMVYSPAISSPFSFLNCIFVPPAGLEAAELLHEQAHVRHWHSVDVVVLELLRVVFWFHPVIHWYYRSLRLVHEYAADAAVVKNLHRKQYGLLLIRQSQSGPALAFANHFFQSPLKQRLIMLTRENSPLIRAWKYALAVPVCVLLLQLVQQSPVQAQQSPTPAAAPAPASESDKVLELTELQTQPSFPGGDQGLMQFLSTHITYPEEARTHDVEGMVAISFVVDRTGSIMDVKHVDDRITSRKQAGEVIEANDVLNRKAALASLVKEALKAVSVMPAWSPGIDKAGNRVNVRFTLPIKFKLS